MMRLFLLALAIALLPLSSTATPTPWRRGEQTLSEDEFNARLLILFGENSSSLSAQKDIDTNMHLKLPFYGLQITARTSGDDDEWSFVPGSNATFAKWPDGSYAQLLWCLQAANETMRAGMAACGAQATCNSEFVVYSTWGVADGMHWKKDGVMLYQCVGVQTTKSKCADPTTPPCELNILGDFHEAMWPATNSVNIIGSGATTMAQITTELDVYAKRNDLSWSLPTNPWA